MLDTFEANELLDVYGPLLTKRQQEILDLYYREDLSYFEISEELGISRSAIQDAVSRAGKQLRKYEDVVGYVKKRNQILQCENVEEIKKLL